MKKKFYYLYSLLSVFIIPSCVAAYFVADRISTLHLTIFVAGITVIGGIWDVWAARHGRTDPVWIWQFNFKETLGIRLFGLPIEEYLFYVASSVYVVFMWEAIGLALEKDGVIVWVIPTLGLWTLLAILTPYFLKNKKDRLI